MVSRFTDYDVPDATPDVDQRTREIDRELVHIHRFDHQDGKAGGIDTFYAGMRHAEKLLREGGAEGLAKVYDERSAALDDAASLRVKLAAVEKENEDLKRSEAARIQQIRGLEETGVPDKVASILIDYARVHGSAMKAERERDQVRAMLNERMTAARQERNDLRAELSVLRQALDEIDDLAENAQENDRWRDDEGANITPQMVRDLVAAAARGR